MIFVGSGSFVWRAAAHAESAGKQVDAVIHPAHDKPPKQAAGLTTRVSDDVNRLADFIKEVSTDQVICSTGNPLFFRAPVLDLGFNIVNIHGGPLPGYRGHPIAAAVFALLRAEHEFGVTLHRVDQGIDTGPIIAKQSIALSTETTLEELLLEVGEACHQIFVDNLDRFGAEATQQREAEGECFTSNQLRELGQHRTNPNFNRATDLGVFGEFMPFYAELFEKASSEVG